MRLEAARTAMDCRDLVRCARGLSGSSTLGCGATLGGGTTLGYGVSLGGNGVTVIVVGTQTFLVSGRRVSGLLITGVVGGDMYAVGLGMVVLGIQLVNSSCSLGIVVNCSWWLVTGAYLFAQEIIFRAWMILSSVDTVGWVS